MVVSNWQTVPVFGSWFWPNGDLRPGTYKVSSNAQVVSASGSGIVLPKGIVKIGQLNTDESALNGHSFWLESPRFDDPDMFPQGFQLQVDIVPEGAERIVYLIQPGMDDAFIDVSDIVLPQVLPPGTPDLVAGTRGGLAKLDAITGEVLDADGHFVGRPFPGTVIKVMSTEPSRPTIPFGCQMLIQGPRPEWALPGDWQLG